GKAPRPEDKARNVLWAVHLVSQFPPFAEFEWAGLVSRIFAEARDLGLPVAVEDRVRLCEVLASVSATDPLAAAAYHDLAAAAPEAAPPLYAWRYRPPPPPRGPVGRPAPDP